MTNISNFKTFFAEDIWTANYVGGKYIANIGLPIFLLVISIGSIIWFIVEVKRKTIKFKNLVSWFSLCLLYTVIVLYVLIVTILQILGIARAINVFDWISHYLFGFTIDGGKEWIFLFLLGLSAYLLIATLRNSIKISKFKTHIDKLNKKVAILAGKIEKTDSQNKRNSKK